MAVGAVAAVGITGAVAAFGDDDTRGEVVRVIDGDTLVARIDGDDVRVRLLNVDTPETKDPEEAVQCMGPEASAYLEKRLPTGTEIELEYDQERTDRYDRTLAAVFESGSLVNAEIAAEGLGLPVLFEPNDRFLGEVTRASAAAEREQKGLFAPSVECTLPAQAQQVSEAIDAVPAQVDGDPAEALGHAADAAADADAFVVALDARNFSDLGNVVFATSTMAPYIDSLRERVTVQRDSVEQKRSDLKEAKTSFDDRQTQETLEKERAESEVQQEKARASESAEQKSRSSQQKRTTKKKAPGTSSSSRASSSSKRSPSNPSSAPKTSSSSKRSSSSKGSPSANGSSSKRSSSSSAAEHTGSSRMKSRSGSTSSGSSSSSSRSAGTSGSSSSKGSKGSGSAKSSSSKGRSGSSSGSKRRPGSTSSGSSCAPYGPEIPYSNPGGYTGKRYGMPGGKTFRKCK